MSNESDNVLYFSPYDLNYGSFSSASEVTFYSGYYLVPVKGVLDKSGRNE